MNQSFSQKLKGFLKSWEMVLICILVAEFVIFGAANDKFLRPAMLFNSMNDFMSICIISLFVTFVMITGGIDIQAGSIVGLTSIIIGVTWQDFGFNIWAAAGFALLIAVICGALSGFFVAYCGVQAMVVTLAAASFIQESHFLYPIWLLQKAIRVSAVSRITSRSCPNTNCLD